ncbi:MAG: hypothetical protein K8T89_15255, partial [Planctomycetes bacterium]|nr:hypothetical protein [Planctomycetota bacterium]
MNANRYSVVLVCLFVWSGQAVAQTESFDKPPPPDKDLLAKIEALADNTWMNLPAVKTAGDLSWQPANGDFRRRGPMV